MNKDEITEKVKAIVVEVTGIKAEKLDIDANFIDDLGIESVMAVGIVSKVEKEFKEDIPADRFGDLDSVASIVDVICDLVAA